MSISDKTRKILWGRSGNRCAICKHELIVGATPTDDESVIGDECHIVSSQANGPRHNETCSREKLDLYDNLILLCRVHHKMVDDQDETYTVEILKHMKANHELWVSDKLANAVAPKPLKLRRVKENIPTYLSRLTTGKQILNLIIDACTYSMDHDELTLQEEVDLVTEFLQTVHDWGEIGNDFEPRDRVNTAYDLTRSLNELERAGFFVFGGREVQLLEGGNTSESSTWPVAILLVLRKDNTAIIYTNSDGQIDLDSGPP